MASSQRLLAASVLYCLFVTVPGVWPADEYGPSMDVSATYAAVAPATVVVRTENGHGTGFVMDPAGWVLTNHHVVADTEIDPKTCTRSATIYFGQLNEDGFMQLTDEAATAEVYAVDAVRDLALLRLTGSPKSEQPLPSIRPAAKVPGPGSPCVVIGHPAAGMLWTVRSGLLAGSGIWPSDRIDAVMERSAGHHGNADHSDPTSSDGHRRRIIISSCGLNPGDSGSAPVNSQGDMIGVSFAIPGAPDTGGVHLDKFSYHVHLEEVLVFLRDRPQSPQIWARDAWPAGTEARMIDIDNDGVDDALGFTSESGQLVGLALDLDRDTRAKKSGLLGARSEGTNYEFEFAIHFAPVPRTFYDTNNDGEMDLITGDLNGDGEVEQSLRLSAGEGVMDTATCEQRIAPERFSDATLADRRSDAASLLANPPIAESGKADDRKLNTLLSHAGSDKGIQ